MSKTIRTAQKQAETQAKLRKLTMQLALARIADRRRVEAGIETPTRRVRQLEQALQNRFQL